MTHPELAFFLLPLTSLLWAVGGTWKKSFRRFGIPIVCASAAVFYLHFTYWFLVMGILQIIAFSLPITLKGDSVVDGWLNVFYAALLGVIWPLPTLIVAFECAVPWDIIIGGSFLSWIAITMCVFFSNLPYVRHLFLWKFCEISMGALVAYPIPLYLNNVGT